MKIDPGHLKIVVGFATIIGGLAAYLAYQDNKKKNAVQKEVSLLEKEIKELELLKIREEAKNSGLITG